MLVASLLSLWSRSDANIQWQLFPQKEDLLASNPVSAAWLHFDKIETVQQISEHHPHLDPSEATMRESALLCGCTHSTQETSITHFMPIQFRGPMPNGLSAALSSALKAAGGLFSQRCGRNSVGRWKLLADRFAAHRFIVTLVCGGTALPATTAAFSMVERKSMSGAGGYRRRLSCSTALRYSCCSNLV
jgi:hypothetical protein